MLRLGVGLSWLLPLGVIGCTAASLGGSAVAAHRPHDVDAAAFRGVTLAPIDLNAPADLNHVFVAGGTMQPRTVTTLSFVLPELAGVAGILLGDSIEWAFHAPNGEAITPGRTENRPGFEYSGSDGLGTLSLKSPGSGKWAVDVRAGQADSIVPYAIDLMMEGTAPVMAHIETMVRGGYPYTPGGVRSGEVVYVRAFLVDRKALVPGGAWSVTATTQSDSTFTVPVFDDGRHADGGAHDGIHVGAFRCHASDGGYGVRAACRAANGVDYSVITLLEVTSVNRTDTPPAR